MFTGPQTEAVPTLTLTLPWFGLVSGIFWFPLREMVVPDLYCLDSIWKSLNYFMDPSIPNSLHTSLPLQAPQKIFTEPM